jgi:F-type H+-transporting ATPase subunit delta
MKVSVKQYAQSLYEATMEKKHPEIDGALSNFVKVLAKNGQMKFKNNIIKKFQEIYNRENGIVEAEVISREKMSRELRNKVSNYVSKKYGSEKVILNEKINENIQGGIIIRVGDEVMDGSIHSQLNKLKNFLAS